jgi:hypothetical protein
MLEEEAGLLDSGIAMAGKGAQVNSGKVFPEMLQYPG